MNPVLFVALITWADDDAEEFIAITGSESQAERLIVNELQASWTGAPGLFHDDAPEFLSGPPLDVATATDELVHDWLIEFRDATTAPWWSINEREVQL